jgi:hypothetical protein
LSATAQAVSPSAAPRSISRRSTLPDKASNPLWCSSAVFMSPLVTPCTCCNHSSAPGSTDPLRTAITAPSRGVNPMLVSTL